MAEGEKKGFFRRLFGSSDPQPEEPQIALPEAEAEAEDNQPEDRQPEDNTPTEVGEQVAPDEQVAPVEQTLETNDLAIEQDPVDFVPEPEAAPEPKKSWFQRLTSGLSRSSTSLTTGITSIFTKRKLDDETIEELEDILIQADLGIETAMAITESLAKGRYDKMIEAEEVKSILSAEVEKVLDPVAQPLVLTASDKPQVILMVGVNGSGKTTTIGKLAAKLRAEGKTVMLAAGDTFRAAAIEQLKIWAERTGSSIVARPQGSDAAGLAFDAMQAAKEAGTDVLMIDTAGRLQNRVELMAELEKVIRVIRKHDETAPHHVLLTLDATTGQNAMNQVEVFGKTAGVTGLVMTKLDGTARGGILVAISARHKMPVHFIGVGEGVDDLESFAASDFARAIAGVTL